MPKHTRSTLMAFAVATGLCGFPVAAVSREAVTTVPFRIEQIYGHRPVVSVSLNGHPYHMVVHSSAGFFMQIPHDLAARIGVTDVRHAGTYGISAPGRTSRLGRDEAKLRSLSIGGHDFRDVPVSIFETPGDQSTGMLGLDWIAASRAMIDYPAHRVSFGGTQKDSDAVRDRLVHAGYVAIPMQRSADKRYVVPVTVGTVTRPMTVSTVAGVNVDRTFVDAAGIGVGPVKGQESGPLGASLPIYATRSPLTLVIHGWRSRPIADASIVDMAGYMSTKRAAGDLNGGALGADFMVANGAIIDFGGMTLYLRSAPR